ncbi:restriction endonuclease subunit S [Desulfolutivibrio sulfoxidireducens]|uniref:restriction endonuclease subunit S n=1 Tax=Desulfolutivibrio sulfoxidireducens TaxID=2773299 RepID=UPI00159E61DF|nr:restriction endonuclease subunit S [Desulfolutivibrio sulfoxidireducens]QLA20935.1 restriction endonuclease subunit S [Desulfolutivibrio sulfoxidireducens]
MSKTNSCSLPSPPSDWKFLPFRNICLRLIHGGTPSTLIAAYWNGKTPWITGADFENNNIKVIRRHITDRAIKESSTNIVPKGRILLVSRTGVGKIAIAEFDVAISQDITGLDLNKSEALDKYIYYALQNEIEEIKKYNQGTSINGILREDLLKHHFYIPSYTEQQSIADILTTIDNLIDHTESLIAKYQSIKLGMMHDLFTRGVDANGRLRPPRKEAPELYKESALGWIPKEWEVVQLSDIANVNRGKFTARPRNDPMYYGGQYPFIQTGDVTNNCGRVITHFSQTLSEPGKSVSRSFPPGTIAVTIAANIADTSILGIEMFFPDSIVGIEVNHEHSVRFIELCIRMNKPFLDAKAPQSAQKNINLNDLRPLLVPLPPPDEQHKISKIYETIECNSRTLEENMTKFQIMKSGLMHDLLTGTIRIPPHLTPAQEPPHAV